MFTLVQPIFCQNLIAVKYSESKNIFIVSDNANNAIWF